LNGNNEDLKFLIYSQIPGMITVNSDFNSDIDSGVNVNYNLTNSNSSTNKEEDVLDLDNFYLNQKVNDYLLCNTAESSDHNLFKPLEPLKADESNSNNINKNNYHHNRSCFSSMSSSQSDASIITTTNQLAPTFYTKKDLKWFNFLSLFVC
jgi:hypothetical protein